MQRFSKLLIVLPCHSLEDFPTHYQGEEAANLLANWTALWHPALIASVGEKPDWHQADNPELNLTPKSDTTKADSTPEPRSDALEEANEIDPDDDLTKTNESLCLVLVPAVSEPVMDSELRRQLETNNVVVISDLSTREEITSSALSANEHAKMLSPKLDPQIEADFHALGYAFLQIQIMTRQLRYSSNLDEAYFSDTVVAAAQFAVEGDHEQARLGITKCFDILLEEKNAYYPVQPELLDVVLTAPTTLGKSLDQQLKRNHAFNVLLTGVNAEKLANSNPDAVKQLKLRVGISDAENTETEPTEKSPQKITIIGGLQDELPESLVSTESLVHQISVGRKTLQRILSAEPAVFMRRRFGLTPMIPGVLEQFNFTGAIHATLDDGKFPICSSSNIRWTGIDERSVLAFGEAPLSAADEGSFLGLGVKLGESIDSAHIAAVVFCHWPNQTCQSFEDILRVSQYSPLFGSFIGLESYFESVYDPGYGDTFSMDEYRPPYLKQAIANKTTDPISRVTRYWNRFYGVNRCRALLTQLCGKTTLHQQAIVEITSQLTELQNSIEVAINSTEDDPEIDIRIANLTQQLATKWATPDVQTDVERQHVEPKESSQNDIHHAKKSTTLVNTTSFKRRIVVHSDTAEIGSAKNVGPIVYADSNSNGTHWVVEIPPMGSVRLPFNELGSTDAFRSDPEISDGQILRNEFFELTVDDKTGGIRSIQLYHTRLNLVAQQLAIRIPSERDGYDQPLTKARYTKMVADKIDIQSPNRLSGSIITQGKLIDGSETLAKFKQIVSLSRGRPIANVKVELSLLKDLSHSVNHYVCSRMAWKSEASRVIANTQEARHEVSSDWFNATNFIEIAQDEHRLTMLTGGLPYHRRANRRMLDSLLIAGAESQRQFSFGLGVDLPYGMAAAIDQMTPAIEIQSDTSTEPSVASNWMFHFSAKNIQATHWEPLLESTDPNQTQWSGVRIRLRETEGRKGKLTIRCPQPIANAERINFSQDFLQAIHIVPEQANKIDVEFGSFDYFQIAIYWKK